MKLILKLVLNLKMALHADQPQTDYGIASLHASLSSTL
jgi:hypothetical protein